jgi:hypothetical protein
MPWPNWYVIGPNTRLFASTGVKGGSLQCPTLLILAGVFDEGDYTSYGGDMEELKSWLISQMLWDPSQDDRALIAAFLEVCPQSVSSECNRVVQGYYGPAAPLMQQYLDLFSNATAVCHDFHGLSVTLVGGRVVHDHL